MKRPYVVTAAILTTDKCSAACKECCFQCTPKNNNRLSLEEMKLFIDELVNDFHEVNSVVFTGGECFLLNEDLYSIIEYSTSKGLATRCVTNGFWGKDKNRALETVKKLKECGLIELNFSTGDNHQEWVPFQNIVNASLAALQFDISVVISVENHSSAVFKIEDVYKNKEIEDFMKKNEKPELFSVISSLWIPFHKDVSYSYNFKIDKSEEKQESVIRGCDSILEYIGLNPKNEVISCCGLTISYIDSMNLGKLNDNSLLSLYKEQLDDFLKIWIWVDGTEYIYNKITTSLNIEKNENLVHPCQFCAEIYNNKLLTSYFEQIKDEDVLEVLNKYHVKLKTINKSNLKGSVLNG
ncbi:radical SAM protein [Enterococcus termitis]|uniref:Radical SAM core domain-containing protein n=1 Tax=Enterococcus termitis TaxID=332950 RepID=A0A1E5GB97_9ENTE|nr:radical SAM protein [Enterococcus termitis]OEG09865.1 hypothetical protein BCR25_10195 [Enterococcus termitis]